MLKKYYKKIINRLTREIGLQDTKEIKDLKKRFLNLKIEENVQIKNPNKLYLGKNIVIQKGTILHCGGMEWSGFKGQISIDDNSVISPYCILYGAGNIKIGKNFDCGPCVGIYSSRSDYLDKNRHIFSPISIGDNVTIYANVIINCGVTIGDDSVIGAGSLVLENIPENEFWAGTPAKFIKKIK